MLTSWEKSYDKLRQCMKKQRHHFADKGLNSQSYGFSSSHVWVWELGHQEAECQRIDAFELWCWRCLRIPWTSRRSNQSILKEINPEYSLEGRMLKLKLQYFGRLIQRANSLEKTLMLGKIEKQEEKGMTEDEMAGWYHWLNRHESEQVSGDCEGQGGLACCSPPGRKEWDTTERLKWTDFRNRFYDLSPHILHLLISREALNRFMVTSDPHD